MERPQNNQRVAAKSQRAFTQYEQSMKFKARGFCASRCQWITRPRREGPGAVCGWTRTRARTALLSAKPGALSGLRKRSLEQLLAGFLSAVLQGSGQFAVLHLFASRGQRIRDMSQ